MLVHSDRVIVWCAVSQIKNTRPYIFDDENQRVTVNYEQYGSTIQNILYQFSENLKKSI